MTSDVYIVGMSNTESLRRAVLSRYSGNLKFEFDNLHQPEKRRLISKNGVLHSTYFADKVTSKLVVSMMYGNWYMSVAFIENPVPFDFWMPACDLPVDEKRHIIPYAQIHRKFNDGIRYQMSTLVQLRGMVAGRLIHLESPPPIRSEEHIRKYPGYFAKALSAGISPAATRWKLWRLQSLVIAEICAENGVDFISFPDEASDPEGFLKDDYQFNDHGHANSRYGAIALKQIERIYAGEA
jgi:hypothetical protein